MPASHSGALQIGVWLDDLQLGVREALRFAGGAGAEAAGLDAFGPEVNPRVLSGTGRRDLAGRIRSAGLMTAALLADVGGRRLADPARLDANLTRLREAFELARALGAPRVVLPLGFVPPTGDAAGASARRALGEAIQLLVGFGETLGVRPAAQAGAEPPLDLDALLKEHDPGGLFEVDLHPGVLVSRGQEPAAALNVFAARVGLATAADFYRGGGEAPFGRGDVPWGELLIGLSTLSRREALPVLAACARECDRKAALANVIQGLLKLRANPLG